MNKRLGIIGGLLVVIVAGIGTTVYLLSQQQDVRSRAQSSDTCTALAAPGNLKLNYPDEQGDQSNFAQANCTWDAVSGATRYNATVTEVDTNTTVTTQSIQATKITFSVTSGKTYKCDISAVNSCGQAGAVATDQLLCQAEVESVTPTIPGSTPVPTVPGSPTSTPVPQITNLSCGQIGCSSNQPCIAGLQCVTATNGQAYCAYPIYASACQQSPSVSSCCTAPAAQAPPVVTVPPTGDFKSTIFLGVAAVGTIVVGGLLLVL